MVKKRPEKIFNTVTKTVNNEKSDEFRPRLVSTSYLSVAGRKSRQRLTEVLNSFMYLIFFPCFPSPSAQKKGITLLLFNWSLTMQIEKEARRLRRVLANREAARQTILRRQVNRHNQLFCLRLLTTF